MLTLRHSPFELLSAWSKQFAPGTDLVPAAEVQESQTSTTVVLETPRGRRSGSIMFSSGTAPWYQRPMARNPRTFLPRTVAGGAQQGPEQRSQAGGDSPAQRVQTTAS